MFSMFHDALNRIRLYSKEDIWEYAFRQIFYDRIDEPDYSTVFSVYYLRDDNEDEKIVTYFFDRNGVLRKLYSRTAMSNSSLVEILAAANNKSYSFRYFVDGGEFYLFDDKGCCVRYLLPKSVVPRRGIPHLQMVVLSSFKNNSFNTQRDFIVVSSHKSGDPVLVASDTTFSGPPMSVHDFALSSLDCWLSNTSDGAAAFQHEMDVLKSDPTNAINYVAIHRMPEEVLNYFWPLKICECEDDFCSIF